MKRIKKKIGKYLLLKNSWAAWGVLIFGLVITLAIWARIKNDAYDRARVRFDYTTDEIHTAIQKRMKAYEQVLKGGVGIFNVKPDLSRKEFKIYVDNLELEKNYPGILGVGFCEKVLPQNLAKHIASIRTEGYPKYNVFPDYKRDVYLPIVYIEPFSGRNLRAFGYDMFTEEHRKEAMTYALETNTVTATEPVILVQETDVDIQKGFLMYAPVYLRDADVSTVQKRKDAFLGFVYSPFRVNDLLRGILGSTPEDIALTIHDSNTEADSALLYKEKEEAISTKPVFTKSSVISINNRTWMLRFHSTKKYDEVLYSQESYIILFSGIIISLLLALSALAFARNKEVYSDLQGILESTGEGIYGLDQNGKCMFINRAALEMIGHKRETCEQIEMHPLIHYKKENGDPYPIEECPLHVSLVTQQKITADDEVFWKKDGTGFHVEFTANPMFLDGEMKGTVVAFKDITQRKKYEEKIKNSLKEKEVLLKEIHHRVKNNMQIISSLLNLQSQYVQDKDDYIKIAFQDSQNRIRSMALIHEKLYQSEDFSHMNFGDYAKELVVKLVESYRQNFGNVNVDIQSNNIILTMDTSISLGLILNELVTNCFKHAFISYNQGHKISIILTREEQSYELKISDNGRGFPENIDYTNTDSLGLQLVNTLVYQINGSVSMESNEGTTFIINFPLDS